MNSLAQGIVAGAAPGIGAGLGNMKDQKAANAIPANMAAQTPAINNELSAANAASDLNNPDLQAALHPMADPNHPVWNVLGPAAGGMPAPPPAGIPAAGPGMAEGGVVGASKGPLPANFGGARGYQNGGAVRVGNFGSQTLRPEFTRGPALPVGPNAGIVPASTEGQVLTMADGGAVPMGMPASGVNFMPTPSVAAPPVTGRNAGIAAGLSSGMAMGHNLMEQYRQSQQRSSAEDAMKVEEEKFINAHRQANGLPTTDEQASGGGLAHTVGNYVSNVFHMFHEKSLDDQHNPNQPMEGSPNFKQPGALPAAPTAVGAPNPQAAPVGGAPAPGTAPPAAPPSAAAPAAPGAPANPGAIVGAKAAQTALQKTGDAQQATASAAAVGAARNDPNAQAGIGQSSPEASGKTAHSLTPQDWEDMERAKFKAARAATAAGMDGGQVYQALTAMQTSHFQGQYLKNVGAAQQALAKGDYDGMEKALRSANYYLPNGQDLNLRKATADDSKQYNVPVGTPLVTNPFYGMPGHTAAEGAQRIVPINSQSLQGIAEAAFDPTAFVAGQVQQYKVGIQAQTDLQGAQAKLLTGQGMAARGSAMMGNMYTKIGESPAVISDKRAHADLMEAQAGYYRSKQAGTGGSKVKIKPSDVARAQQDAARAVDEAAQGPLTTTPATVQDPTTGMMVPNPHGNQPMHDPNKISPLYAGMSAQERDEAKGYAGEIHAANLGENISAQTSADIAARIVANNREAARGHVPSHVNPTNGKTEKNVVPYMAKGSDGNNHPALRVWADGHYLTVWTTPNVESADSLGNVGINVGGGAGSSSEGGGSAGGSDENLEE
jgi:hypothetical protein